MIEEPRQDENDDEIMDIPQDTGMVEGDLEQGPPLDYGRPITRKPDLEVKEES